MSDKPIAPTFCGERKRLDQELSVLLSSKSALREQIAGEVFTKPAERRAKLVQLNEMIDDVIALMREHYKHCSCERTGSVAQASSSGSGGSHRRRQPRKPFVAVQI